jgi:predicted metalloenzyme YecM
MRSMVLQHPGQKLQLLDLPMPRRSRSFSSQQHPHIVFILPVEMDRLGTFVPSETLPS